MIEPVKLSCPATDLEWERYYELRWRVLRAPWGLPRGSERDDLEAQCFHLMACHSPGLPVGVGRLQLNAPERAQIRFMAVAENYRRQGIGTSLLAALEEEGRRRGAKSACLNARAAAVRFYERHGFLRVRPGPTLFGLVAHVFMQKTLSIQGV